MVRNRLDRHGASQHLVDHGIREPPQLPAAIALVVSSLSQRHFGDPFYCVENLGSEGICHNGVALFVSIKRVGYVALSAEGDFQAKRRHRAPSLARASLQGTDRAALEPKSLLRCRISSAQALATLPSSSPSKLSRSASATAERSCGARASASSIRWCTRAFILRRITVPVSCVPHQSASRRRAISPSIERTRKGKASHVKR